MVRDGSISIARKARVGYLEQKGVSGSTKSVRGEVASRMDRLQAATKALEAAEAAVASGDTSDDALSKLEVANTEFELAGGYTVEQKVSNILRGLGFAEEDYDRLCSEFSGGWQMRIALARLLLSEPDLLFLDEPSNHLDKAARDWLGTYLSAYDGTLLIVSHDTELLDVAANSIAEVRAGKIELYKSRSHEQWLVERDERVKMAQIQYEANQREIDRLQGFVDRFGAKTMGASMAQSRLKTIEKLSANGPEAPVISDGPTPVLRLPPPPRGSAKLLELKDVKLAWPAAKADATSPFIIRDCSLRIERGMRIAVRGPNGAGMSTEACCRLVGS
jgi:ATPase subunit of ABC transporter with duplicated ATPase domains